MELTHILVVSHPSTSRDRYQRLLEARFHRAYGGTSAVSNGAWIMLVTGGSPTADKPGVTLAAPAEPEIDSHSLTIRVPDCRRGYEVLTSRGAEGR